MSDATRNLSATNESKNEPRYFVHDYSKISPIEAYRVAFKAVKRHPIAMFAMILHLGKKALGKPMRDGVPFHPFNTTFIEFHEIPAEVTCIQEPFVKSLADAGFTPTLAVKTTSEHGSGYGLILRSNDGLSVANVTFVQVGSKEMHQQKRTITIAGLQVASRRTSGDSIVTTNAPPGFRLPSYIQILHLKGASPEEVIARHRRRTTDLTDIEFVGRDDTRRRVEERHRRLVEFQISRGFYSPATEEELRRHGLRTASLEVDASK